jgi:PIN domain nuclease of toxin-antitoxin system
MTIVLDTHAVIWSLIGPEELSPAAVETIRGATEVGDPVYVPSISIVEVVYLVERGRLPSAALTSLIATLNDADSGLVVAPLNTEVAEAVRRIPRDVVPDMPDRIIAATAFHLGPPLVTRDQRIRSAGLETIW